MHLLRYACVAHCCGQHCCVEAEKFNLRWTSDATLRVGSAGDAAILESRVTALRVAIEAGVRDGSLPGVLECTATAVAVQVVCDPLGDAARVEASIRRVVERVSSEYLVVVPAEARLVVVPVCYDPSAFEGVAGATREQIASWGDDLAGVARDSRLSIDEVIALHGSVEYRVQFLGFAPGFAYLAGLPVRLDVARLSSPRALVPAGSVAIAAGQAGLYALPTPGGWRLLGRTAIKLFDPTHGATLRQGDRIRFESVSLERFVSSASP